MPYCWPSHPDTCTARSSAKCRGGRRRNDDFGTIGRCFGAAQAGRKRSLRLLTLLSDEALIGQAREEATTLVEADPELVSHPALAAAIGSLLDEEQAEFLEKT